MIMVTVLGFHVRTAPIWLRERLARLYDGQSDLQTRIPGIACIALQTCNRFELYCAHEHHPIAYMDVMHHMSQQYGIAETILAEHCYWYSADHACQHLMRVACGLDSVTLGESQILGQIRHCFTSHPPHVPALRQLFMQALKAGRLAHQQTDIGRHTTSIAHAAITLLRHHQQTPRVLVIGAGEMGTLAATALHQQGIEFGLCNRSPQRAQHLIAQTNAHVVPWEYRHQALAEYTSVIVATSAPTYVLTNDELEHAPHACTVVDISMPRNVDPLLRTHASIQLYGIDDLQQVLDRHHQQRQQAIPAVEHIIAQQLSRWHTWLHHQHAKADIIQLRQWATHIQGTELQRAMHKLTHQPDNATAILGELSHRLTQKLLHPQTMALRTTSRTSPCHSNISTPDAHDEIPSPVTLKQEV